MTSRAFYKPCSLDPDLDHERCFDCAVDYVIQALGWNINCECISIRRPHCGNCRLFEDYRTAFAMAEPPYRELARARLHGTGIYWTQTLARTWRSNQDVDEASRILLAEAVSDPVSYEAALLLFNELTASNQPIPHDLQLFVAEAALGLRAPAKKIGRYPSAQDTRDRKIARLVYDLTLDMRLKATSGKLGDNKSACNAVARALLVLGLSPSSYEAVRKIWGNRIELLSFSTSRRV